MMCILPYHDSKIFVRAVQTMNFSKDDAAHWRWLVPIQKHGVHLATSTLVSHCRKNTAFLSFICDIVGKFIKASDERRDSTSPQFLKNAFSFYTMVILSVLETTVIIERLATALIEPIGRGLQSRIPVYQASSYMIMTQLFFKVKLSPSVIEPLVALLCKTITPTLGSEAITCLLVIFQTQDVRLHKKDCKHLYKTHILCTTLKTLAVQFDVQPLVTQILRLMIPAAFKESACNILSSDSSDDESGPTPQLMPLLQDFITNIKLRDDTAMFVAKNVLNNFLTYILNDQEHEESHYTTVRGIVRQLEAQYPNALDVAVDDLMLSCDSPAKKEAVSSFLNLSALTTKHQILPTNSTSLVLCLNHRQASVRKSAVTYMLENMDSLDDKEFISESILARLHDDNKEIVKSILNNPKLPDLVQGKEQLQDCLLKLLQTYRSSMDLTKLILQWICSIGNTSSDKVLATVLSHLFLLSKNKDILVQILNSPLAEKNPIINRVRKGCRTMLVEGGTAINQKLSKSIAHAMIQTHGDTAHQHFRSLFDVRSSLARPLPFLTVLMLSLSKAVTMTTDEHLKIKLGLELLHMMQIVAMDKECMLEKPSFASFGMITIKEVLAMCGKKFEKERKIPLEFIACLLQEYIASFSIPQDLLECHFWNYHGDDRLTDDWLKLAIKLFSFLLSLIDEKDFSKFWKKILTIFVQSVFSDQAHLFKLFCLMWTQHLNPHSRELGLTVKLQAQGLALSLIQCQSLDELACAEILDRPAPELCSLLVVFTSPYDRLRDLALDCLLALTSSAALYRPLVDIIAMQQEEISTDPMFLRQVFLTILNDECQRSADSSPSQAGIIGGIVDVLCAENTPRWMVKSLLILLEGVNSIEILTQLLPLLDRLLCLSAEEFAEVDLECTELLLARFTVSMSACLAQDSPHLRILTAAIECQHQPVSNRRSVAEIAVKMITGKLFSALEDVQQTILRSLFNSWLSTTNISVSNAIRHCTKKTLSLKAEHIIAELKPVLKTTALTMREAKQSRKETSSTIEVSEGVDFPEWQRVMIILEAVQDKKALEQRASLIPVCFQVLSKALELDDYNNAEYVKQLLLTTIYNLCHRMEKDNPDAGSIPEEHFSMELIVKCIRSSDNPQTHHQALLVLTVSAKICPEHLLHNIMSVFTFMGANVLRQDDSYSFHVISKILENVIPALINTCRERSPRMSSLTTKPEDVITMVMRVFVDAFPHIPEHRKLMLYTKLLRIVGEKEHLWRCLMLFVEHFVTRDRKSGRSDTQHILEEKMDGPISPTEIEFMQSLSTSFSPRTQLLAARDVVVYIMDLPEERDDTALRVKSVPQSLVRLKKEESEIFNLHFHTARQLQHFKYAGIHFIVTLLSNPQFVAQVADHEGKKWMEKRFQFLLESLLQFITQVTATCDQHVNKPTAKFWKLYLHKAYELLEKIGSLLPDMVFVSVMSGLLKHDLPTVQRKAMELINTRLMQFKDAGNQEQEKVLLGLVQDMYDIIEAKTLDMDDIEQTAVNGQVALYSINVLCRLLGAKHPEEFIKVLCLITRVLRKRKDSPNILACALLCVGQICSDLKVHVIPHIPMFMPKVIKIFSRTSKLVENELLAQSCVTAINRVVDNLPHFLSPYIQDITLQYCLLKGSDNQPNVTLQQRLQAIKLAMATVLPTRVLLPTIIACYEQLVTDHKECIESLLSLLEAHICHMDKINLAHAHNQILDFFFICLDFRANHPKVSSNQATKIEDAVINTILSMVMKMSEATFRPMLYKVFDWATGQDGMKIRVLTFYRLADRLADKLKSLFTMFAGYIVKHAAEVLDQNNYSKGDMVYFGSSKRLKKLSYQLVGCVLDCLQKCFLHDNKGFVTSERFDTLMQPIIDQMENISDKDDVYKELVSQHLVPCVGQFAVAIRDDALWKNMNYQILLKTRNTESQVKLASLEVLEEFQKRLGEDFMALLPESVPFLAELMEDEDEEVEKKCQAVISVMEQVLGEPLQKYF